MAKEPKELSKDCPIQKHTWEAFRETGLFRFVNAFLYIFGWVIVMEMEDGKVTNVYPAKTIWRGFTQVDMSDAYKKVAELMHKDHEEILKFAKDEDE